MAEIQTTAAGQPVTSSDAQHDPQHSKRWLILAVIGLAQLMIVLDVTIVNIALPDAQKALGFSNGDRQWIVTAYSLAFGSLLLLFGRVSDLVGRRVMFLVGLVVFAAASALGGASPNFDVLVTARALQGVAGAMLAPAAPLPAEHHVHRGQGAGHRVRRVRRHRRLRCGDRHAARRRAHRVPELALDTLRQRRHQRPRDRRRRHPDSAPGAQRRPAPSSTSPGTVLVSAGLFGIVYGFSNVQSHPWSAPGTWGFLAGGVLLLVAFTVWQTRTKHPLLPLRVILERNRGGSYLAMFLTGIGMFGVFLFLNYYLQEILQLLPGHDRVWRSCRWSRR